MRYAPLTLTTLASLIPPEIPADVALLDEGVDDIDPDAIDADLVGITVITGTAPRAYELARQFRMRSIPVVLGRRASDAGPRGSPSATPTASSSAMPRNRGRSC